MRSALSLTSVSIVRAPDWSRLILIFWNPITGPMGASETDRTPRSEHPSRLREPHPSPLGVR